VAVQAKTINAYRDAQAPLLGKFIRSVTTVLLAMADESFPEVRGGGSLILAWQIRNKRVLVVGGGEASFFMPLDSMTMSNTAQRLLLDAS
jgi:hypothetical protein